MVLKSKKNVKVFLLSSSPEIFIVKFVRKPVLVPQYAQNKVGIFFPKYNTIFEQP